MPFKLAKSNSVNEVAKSYNFTGLSLPSIMERNFGFHVKFSHLLKKK